MFDHWVGWEDPLEKGYGNTFQYFLENLSPWDQLSNNKQHLFELQIKLYEYSCFYLSGNSKK